MPRSAAPHTPADDERNESVAVLNEEGVPEKDLGEDGQRLGRGLYPPAAEEVAKFEGESGRNIRGGRARIPGQQ